MVLRAWILAWLGLARGWRLNPDLPTRKAKQGNGLARSWNAPRLAARALRDIPPASAALVAASAWPYADWPVMLDPFTPFVLVAYIETAFQVARRAELVWRVRRLPKVERTLEISYIELWRKILAATDDVRSFVEGWFLSDEPVCLEALSTADVDDWLGRNFFEKERLDEVEVAEVVQMRREIEEMLGHTFFEGPRTAVTPIAPPVDPVKVRQHPLVLYAILAVFRRLDHVGLKALGFERRALTHLVCWSRPGDQSKAPVVFAHGLGVGLPPYATFVRRLAAEDPTRPLVLLELPAVSTTLNAKPLPSGRALAAEVAAAVDAVSPKPCAFVAHSFGSALAAFLARYQPKRIQGLVLVEPICLLLQLAKSTKRVFYDDDVPPLLSIVATDPGNALSIKRRFSWQEALLLAETLNDQLQAPSAVFLADKDQIVPSDEIAAYLDDAAQSSAVPIQVHRFQNAGHGTWQITPDHVDRVVHAALKAARSLDDDDDDLASFSNSDRTAVATPRRKQRDQQLSASQ